MSDALHIVLDETAMAAAGQGDILVNVRPLFGSKLDIRKRWDGWMAGDRRVRYTKPIVID